MEYAILPSPGSEPEPSPKVESILNHPHGAAALRLYYHYKQQAEFTRKSLISCPVERAAQSLRICAQNLRRAKKILIEAGAIREHRQTDKGRVKSWRIEVFDLDFSGSSITETTISRLIKVKFGIDGLRLYWFLAQTSARKDRNPVHASLTFCAVGLTWSKDRVLRARKILKEMGLISFEGRNTRLHYLKSPESAAGQAESADRSKICKGGLKQEIATGLAVKPPYQKNHPVKISTELIGNKSFLESKKINNNGASVVQNNPAARQPGKAAVVVGILIGEKAAARGVVETKALRNLPGSPEQKRQVMETAAELAGFLEGRGAPEKGPGWVLFMAKKILRGENPLASYRDFVPEAERRQRQEQAAGQARQKAAAAEQEARQLERERAAAVGWQALYDSLPEAERAAVERQTWEALEKTDSFTFSRLREMRLPGDSSPIFLAMRSKILEGRFGDPGLVISPPPAQSPGISEVIRQSLGAVL